MIPGIVRNQGERGAIYSDHILLLLVDNMGRRGNDSLYGEGWGSLGLRVLDAVVVNESEAWLLWHNGMEHRFIAIIHSLSAIYQWTALYSYLVVVISNLSICHYGANRHIEVDTNHIALLDVLDREITLVGIEVSLHSLTVYGYAISWLLGIAILVKIARHHLVANPSRNTDQEVGILYAALLGE